MIFFTSLSIPGKPLKSLTASLHKFFQHALTVCGLNSSIAALMEVMASVLLKDFRDLKVWVDINGYSNHLEDLASI